MFKATDELPDGAFSRIVAENGGQDNAFTTTDYTGYIQRVAADRLDLVMGMEADRMVDLTPGEAGVPPSATSSSRSAARPPTATPAAASSRRPPRRSTSTTPTADR
jgi:hypothetical protein